MHSVSSVTEMLMLIIKFIDFFFLRFMLIHKPARDI